MSKDYPRELEPLAAPDTRKRVLIYQPGKVGSTAIRYSLLATGLDLEVQSAHIISEGGLARTEAWHREIGAAQLPDYVAQGRRLNALFRRGDNRPWHVITAFRDPVARIISGFFQDASRLYPDDFPAHGRWPFAVVERHLRRQFDSFHPERDYTSCWFDRELNAVLGIDVYERPFDHRLGYVRLASRDGRIRVLVLQFEKLASAFDAAVPAFLETAGNVALQRVHDSSEKPYGAALRETVERFRLSRETVEKVYSTRFAQHLFSEHERAALRARWSE